MDISELKKAIEGIKSVDSCGIITNSNDLIDEVHVVADYNRNPKQISRDIQSVLISRFNIDIDHKKISIAQLKGIDIESSEEYRLRLKKIEYSISGHRAEVKVILERNEEAFEAMVNGSNTRLNTQRILSTATLKATERFLKKDDLFTFEDVKIVNIADTEVVIISVVVLENGQERRHFGCSQIGRDLNEAVVKATLNAINRRVTMYEDLKS